MSTELVTVSVRNHIADVQLNRADKLNALNLDMFNAIIAAGEAVRDDKSIRAVVLSGNGKGFCAGLDVANFLNPDAIETLLGNKASDYPNYPQKVAWIWKSVPVPVICALHGVAFGGGLQLALAADIRIAHPQTRMSVMEIKWGLVPDMSGTQTLRDLVRLDVAKALTFSGRIVEGVEAEKIGLVTALDTDPKQAAMVMAQSIAEKSPDAICASKYLLDRTWHGDVEANLRVEEQLQVRVFGKPNQNEAVAAGVGDRPANFQQRAFDNFAEFDDI